MPDRVPILMYHEITAEPKLAGHLAVTPAVFASQLDYLKAGGFTTMRADEIAAALAAGSALPASSVALTFDDGFADFHDSALPELVRRGMTATLFVTSGWVTSKAGPGALTWSHLREAVTAGVEIGAHTVGHPQLDQLSAADLAGELAGCKQDLEDRLGVAVPGLSYPFGYSNRRVRAAAAAAGYRYACAVANRLAASSDDQLALPRLTISRAIGPAAFARIAHARRIPLTLRRYRAQTKAYALVRRTRAAANLMVSDRIAQYQAIQHGPVA